MDNSRQFSFNVNGDKLDESQVQTFLSELQDLCAKHSLWMNDCGCCGTFVEPYNGEEFEMYNVKEPVIQENGCTRYAYKKVK